MIAFIRVNFPDTAPAAMWTDAETRAFMDPSIPYSLAHFWKTTTFNEIDMSYEMFDPITITDPRPGYPDSIMQRQALVVAVLNELHRAANPDWDSIDACFIFFAQQGTDLFGTAIGGGYFSPAMTYVPVAVFSRGASCDTIAQEAGHCLGLSHELTAALVEYGCPYSVMSAAYGFRFKRPPDSRLPEASDPLSGNRTWGALIPAAHLYINAGRTVDPRGWFGNPESVVVVPVEYVHQQQQVTLVARDVAIAALPARRVVLAVVPPVVAGGDTYFFELRRPDAGYDQCVGNPAVVILAGRFPSGIGMAVDTRAIRLKYMGRIDVTGAAGALTFVSPQGGFRARISSVAADFGSVELSISSGGGEASYGVILGEPVETRRLLSTSEWGTADVKPCRNFPERRYAYRFSNFETTQVFTARPMGFRQPRYAWYVNDMFMDPAKRTAEVESMCSQFFDGRVTNPSKTAVWVNYTVNDSNFELATTNNFYDIAMTVRVEVSEGADPAAPTRLAVVTGDHGNVDVGWDQAFQADRAECLQIEVAKHSVLTGPGDGTDRPGGLTAAEIRAAILAQLGIGIGTEGL